MVSTRGRPLSRSLAALQKREGETEEEFLWRLEIVFKAVKAETDADAAAYLRRGLRNIILSKVCCQLVEGVQYGSVGGGVYS